MIHGATIEVTCDSEKCFESVHVEPDYVYHDYSGESGQYDTSDSVIENRLRAGHGWIVMDGKHFC